VPSTIPKLRGRAYSAVSFYQAALAAYAGRPREIWQPLLRALVESPAYLAERPQLVMGLVTRGVLPWWTARPSPFVLKVWRLINRTA
jgi:hypothetical protein